MAHTLQIFHGSTTISLSTGTQALIDYVPADDRTGSLTVSERPSIRLDGAAVTDIQTTIQSLQRAFELAERRYDTGRGDRVWIQFQPSGFAALYRSEITRPNPGQPAGSVILPRRFLAAAWASKEFEIALTWTRFNFWEANSETELALSNGSGSGTGGRAIVNIHGASVFDATTVSFNSTNNRITDSGSGLSMFVVGDVISITGSDANSKTFTVEEIDGSDGFIDTNEPITTEAADVITNGTFDADTDWDKGDKWTIAGDVANCDGDQVAETDLTQTSVLLIGIAYSISFDLTNFGGGNVTPYAGTGTAGTARSANGTHVETLTCAGSVDFILRGDADFIGDVDNVIVLRTITIYDIQNYVHIDSAIIAGDLDAACRIEITNDDAGAALETVWIGQNVLGSPEAFPHMLDVIDSDTGTNVVDATSANGFKRTYAISDTEAKITGWTIPTEVLTSADGGYFKAFARFAAGTNLTAVKWRLKVLYSGTVLWSGGQVLWDDTYAAISRLIRAIDTVRLPPFIPENSVPTDMQLELWGVRTGSAINIEFDCLTLMPLDGYRRLRSLDGVVQNSVLIDDSVTDTYYQEVSSEQVRDIAVSGKPIMLTPNEDNRIHFLLHSVTANVADHDRTAEVSIFYRPRRITL